MILDLRHAVRQLRRQPLFAAVTIGVLALGIGASAALFSLVDAVLVRELPFADPDRLVWMYNARTERDRAPFSIADLDDYRRETSTLADLAPFTNWTANLTGGGEPERLEGVRIAGNFFRVLGTRAWAGRTLEPDDERGGRAVMLTYGLWQRRFGADPAVVGQSIQLNGAAHLVVGVLPPGFVFPFRAAEVAVPLSLADDARRGDRGANFLRVVARLKPGVSIAVAKGDLDRTAGRLQREFPQDDARKVGVNLYPLHAEIVSDYAQILWTLFAAVIVLLLVGCGNIANLTLVRATERAGEIAIRRSLGASTGRIARQLAIESAVMATLGGAAGILLAAVGVDAWRALGPEGFPRLSEVAIDRRVLAFACVTSAFCAMTAGVLPALVASRRTARLDATGERTVGADRRLAWVRRTFVGLQMAGAACLLVLMMLAIRGFRVLEARDAGFTRAHALSVQLSLPPNRYDDAGKVLAFADAVEAKLNAIGGVEAAGIVSLMPLSGLLSAMDFTPVDRPAPPPDAVPQAHFRLASPGYFAAVGAALVEGRAFTDHEVRGGQPVAIVSQTLAARHWPNQSAVGRAIRLMPSAPAATIEIVGVVNDIKQFDLAGPPTADLYLPLRQMPAGQAPFVAARMYCVVRTASDPRLLAEATRQAVRGLDGDVAATSLRTLEEVWSASLGSRRLNLRALEVFGQVAMALTAIGVYAVAVFAATMRRRELAVRLAFGATRRGLVRLVMSGEMLPIVAGIAIGLGAAFAAAQSLGGSFFIVAAWDPATYGLVTAVLVAVASAAIAMPAWRAAGADPSELLRS